MLVNGDFFGLDDCVERVKRNIGIILDQSKHSVKFFNSGKPSPEKLHSSRFHASKHLGIEKSLQVFETSPVTDQLWDHFFCDVLQKQILATQMFAQSY